MFHNKTIKAFLKIAGSASRRWWDKDPFMQSAVIAYYAIFSMPGLLIIVISAGSLFFKPDVLTGQLYKQISTVMGVETAKQVQDMIISVNQTNKSLLATIIGLIAVLLGATGVFMELQKALNVIWEVKAKPQQSHFHCYTYQVIFFRPYIVCWFSASDLTCNHYYHCGNGRLGDESLA